VCVGIKHPDPPVDTKFGLEWYGINIQPPPPDQPPSVNGRLVGVASDTDHRSALFKSIPATEKRVVTVSRVKPSTLERLHYSQPTLLMVVPNHYYDYNAGYAVILTPAEFAWASWQRYIDLWASSEITTDWLLMIIDIGFYGQTNKQPVHSSFGF